MVVNAGRRAGKTTLAAMVAVERALDGRRVLLASPTQEQADAFWDKCKEWLREPISSGAVAKNETRRLLQFPNGGRIRAKTAWDADTLRGDWADFLVMDEYAMMKPSAWDQVGAPMLLDNDGDAWFISTPRRKNHFYSHYLRGKSDGERWQAWHFTSYDNPHLSRPALEEITRDLTEEAYRQEIMAEFLDNEGMVFRNIPACLHAPKDATPAQHDGHELVMGADWGKQADYTALSVVCRRCMVEVAHDRFNKIDYHFQRERLRVLYDKWHVGQVLAESNAMGEPVIEELLRTGINVTGFQTTAMSKPPLIESLALALERAEVQWMDDPVWTAELEAYERTVSPVTGRSSYAAPEGMHDDTVMARALAVAAVGRFMEGPLFI